MRKDAEEPQTKKRGVSEPDKSVKEESVRPGKRKTAQGVRRFFFLAQLGPDWTRQDAQEPLAKKRRVSFEPVKEESVKPGKRIGSVIGRKRRARKASKGAR